jgi:ectoine hydroxylase-related dioxygenase (phytanoyl-CoA dioxygenase family)
MITEQQLTDYHRDGYVIVPQLFDEEETDLLARAAREDRELDQRSIDRADGEGGSVRLSLWNHPNDSIYGMVARCERVVGSMEKVLGGEVYHYHSKMILKDARVGGAWAWHQDYGYWYNNGVLFPLLSSVAIAVDPATRENGCMQVLKASHHMGRVKHGAVGEQTGADPERVEQASKRLELVYCEMEPGDALFFHCNTLHRSDRNKSENSRWSLICCYNAARNDPYRKGPHPSYTPLSKVPDSAVLAAGAKRFDADSSEVAWMKDR